MILFLAFRISARIENSNLMYYANGQERTMRLLLCLTAVGSALLTAGCAKPTVEELVRSAAKSKDPDVQVSFEQRIVARGSSSMTPLLKLAHDQDPNVRAIALAAIGDLSPSYSGLDIPSYLAKFPIADNIGSELVANSFAKSRSTQSRTLLRKVIASDSPDRKLLFEYCVYDKGYVAELIVNKAASKSSVDYIQKYVDRNSCKVIYDALKASAKRP